MNNLASRLSCIDLDQPGLKGFRQFISAWLYTDDDLSFVVDPGPLSTIPTLCRALESRGIRHLDYILLTHIHIDHAGGAGALLKEFPNATVICHPEGIRHLVDPARLWDGSRKVLGELAEYYGEIIPIPESSLAYESQCGAGKIRAHLTPGHAQHHLCFQLEELVFVGEALGVRCECDAGIYLRPATPPRFILEVAGASIEKTRALNPKVLAFAHYGLTHDAERHLEIAASQLPQWVEAARQTRREQDREKKLLQWLLQHDPHLARLRHLPEDIQVRERQFLSNSLNGMLDYVDRLSESG